MKRETGFYWVKFYDSWTIMYWVNSSSIGEISAFYWGNDGIKEEQIEEVNETRIERPTK